MMKNGPNWFFLFPSFKWLAKISAFNKEFLDKRQTSIEYKAKVFDK